jgi:hypothetical protein
VNGDPRWFWIKILRSDFERQCEQGVDKVNTDTFEFCFVVKSSDDARSEEERGMKKFSK